MKFQVSMYECKECGRICDYRQVKRDGYGDASCPMCGSSEIEYASTRPAQWVGVAVYQVDRAYGGPEEGGWYYDYGSRENCTVRCFESGDFPQLQNYMDTMKLRYPERDMRVMTWVEELPPVNFPETTPRYH